MGNKCNHPPSRKCFVCMDLTFFESQPNFSSTQTSLLGESSSEEKYAINPLPVPATLPTLIDEPDELPTLVVCSLPSINSLLR